MKLLIDCDFVVYKCCAAAEAEIDFGDDVIVVTSSFKEAYSCVKRELKRIENKFGSFDEMILFFSDSKNFRKVSKRLTKDTEIVRSLVPIDVSLTNYLKNIQ